MCGLWRSPSGRNDDLGIKANRAARWATGRGQKKSSRPVGREDCTRVLRPYRSPAHEGSTAHSSGRSSDSWALNLLPAPSHPVIPAVALCGFRSHLQRRDREGFAPSSLHPKCYRRWRHSTQGRKRCQWVGLRLEHPCCPRCTTAASQPESVTCNGCSREGTVRTKGDGREGSLSRSFASDL